MRGGEHMQCTERKVWECDYELRRCALTCLSDYGLPMDEPELDRLDMCHAKYYVLLNKKRFLAPIPSNPQKILDLGCGTGKSGSSHTFMTEKI